MALNWFRQRENILALGIALIVLVLHLIIINQVDDLMFDENHYVPEAEAIIARGELDNLEHPSLGKLLIAANIKTFGDDGTLTNIWGTSYSDVFAVGSDGTIEHYNGISWSSTDSGTSENLFDVWGSSPTNVYAVGSDGTILHYDSTSWNSMDINTSEDIFGVWGTAESNVFTVGSNGTIQRYNGNSWNPMDSGTSEDLFDIWGNSPSEIFAVGSGGTIQHYDGTLWSSTDSGTSEDLFGIWGSSPSDIFTVGSAGTIQHYDGTSWNSIANHTSEDLFGVWGNSPSDVFAVGSLGTILHYDGGSWNRTKDNTTGFPLNSVWSSSSSNAFAVGRDGVIFEYNGTKWDRTETDPFEWRFFPALFGVAAIILFYLICQRLTSNRYIPLIAVFIFAFENQSFVQSSVAMLDVFSLTFMLASFWLYLRGNYIGSGAVLALAALVKMSGILGGVVIFMHWFFASGMARQLARFIRGFLRRLFSKDIASIPRQMLKLILRALQRLICEPMHSHILSIFKVGISAVVFFLALMPLLDYVAMGELEYPWDRIEFMQDQLSTLTFADTEHEALSHPWDWIISTESQWFWYNPTYESTPTWTVWGLIIPSMCLAFIGAIRRHRLLLFSFFWFAGTYLTWYLILHLTDRVMFKFYFYPTVGTICLAIGFALWKILEIAHQKDSGRARWAIRIPVIAYLIAHVVVFVIMSPYCDWTSRF